MEKLNYGSVRKCEQFSKDGLGKIAVLDDNQYHRLDKIAKHIVPSWNVRR